MNGTSPYITIPQYGFNGNGSGDVTANFGAYCDGYFIAQNPDTNQVNISPPLDAAGLWDSLQFFSKSGAPDRLLATIHDHEELYLMEIRDHRGLARHRAGG